MSALTDTISAVASINVGSGVDATGAFPVLSVTESAEPRGREGQGGVSTVRRTLTLICMAEAATPDGVGALTDVLARGFSRRGVRVELVEQAGTARVFSAGGGSTGEPIARGYPIVSFERLESGAGLEARGALVIFRVTVELVELAADTDPVEHSFTVEEAADLSAGGAGGIRVRQRGTVRTLNDSDARQWAIDNPIATGFAAAAANEQSFTRTITEGADSSTVEYEFTRETASGGGFGFNVFGGRTEVSEQEREDGSALSVRGEAEGPEATLYAEDQRPTVGTNELLTRERVSDPRDPDGRVSFDYTLIRGFDDSDFPGVKLLSFRRDFQIASPGGRPIASATFAETTPVLWRADPRPWVYAERIAMEYIGPARIDTDAVTTLAPGLSADALDDPEVVTHGYRRDGARTLTIERRYVFATDQALPAPEIRRNPVLGVTP